MAATYLLFEHSILQQAALGKVQARLTGAAGEERGLGRAYQEVVGHHPAEEEAVGADPSLALGEAGGPCPASVAARVPSRA